jgi:hypothetical protein
LKQHTAQRTVEKTHHNDDNTHTAQILPLEWELGVACSCWTKH